MGHIWVDVEKYVDWGGRFGAEIVADILTWDHSALPPGHSARSCSLCPTSGSMWRRRYRKQRLCDEVLSLRAAAEGAGQSGAIVKSD